MPNVGLEGTPSYTQAVHGTVTVGTSAVQLPGTNAGTFFLHVPATATRKITIGGAGIAYAGGMTLAPGETSPPLPLASLAALYAISDTAAQSLVYTGLC